DNVPLPYLEAMLDTLQVYPELSQRVLSRVSEFATTLYREGIAVTVVQAGIRLAMERRRARSAADPISSLRYFRPAIEEVRDREQNQSHGEVGYARRSDRQITGFSGRSRDGKSDTRKSIEAAHREQVLAYLRTPKVLRLRGTKAGFQ